MKCLKYPYHRLPTEKESNMDVEENSIEKKSLLFAVLLLNYQDALRRSCRKGKRFHRTRFMVNLQKKLEEENGIDLNKTIVRS